MASFCNAFLLFFCGEKAAPRQIALLEQFVKTIAIFLLAAFIFMDDHGVHKRQEADFGRWAPAFFLPISDNRMIAQTAIKIK